MLQVLNYSSKKKKKNCNKSLTVYSSSFLIDLCEKLDWQVNREGTYFKVVGVCLLAPKGLLLGMHLYF